MYPVEFSKLLACPEVPREWRKVYAVAVYTYARPEELEALTDKDIDLDADVVNVSKAIDSRSRAVKIPKTPSAVRSIPVNAALRPLLKRICKRTASGAPILPVLGTLNDKFRAKLFREHLRKAGVTRPRLFFETATRRQVDVRSCRDSGITWLALAGVPSPRCNAAAVIPRSVRRSRT